MEKIIKKRILTRKLLIFKSAREQMLTTPNGHGFPGHHWVHSNCSLKVLRSGHMKRKLSGKTVYVRHSTPQTKQEQSARFSKSNSRVKKLSKWYKPYNCTFLFQSATSYHIFFYDAHNSTFSNSKYVHRFIFCILAQSHKRHEYNQERWTITGESSIVLLSGNG